MDQASSPAANTTVEQAQKQGTVRGSKRLLELDGLRALAILPVLLYHSYPRNVPVLSALGEAGWMGVDLFFVLSGYLITGILVNTVHREHYYRNFIARRAIRIFPLYYVLLLVIILTAQWMYGAASWGRMQAWGVGWFFVYLGNVRQVWLNHPPNVESFSPLWSLQVEEQFYLLFPLAVWLLSRRNLMRLLTVCAVVAPLMRIYLWYRHPADTDAMYMLTSSRIDALSLGGLAALLTLERPAWLRRERLMIVGALAGATAFAIGLRYGFLFYHDPLMRTIGFTPIDLCCASILCLVVLSPESRITAALRWKPLVYTGTIAYGMYLLHMPAAVVVRKVAGHFSGSFIEDHSFRAMAIVFPAAFLCASLSWRFFEEPILKLKGRFSATA
jgi:peptidoglycan/LPS O-acetylase OafA/YrhL